MGSKVSSFGSSICGCSLGASVVVAFGSDNISLFSWKVTLVEFGLPGSEEVIRGTSVEAVCIASEGGIPSVGKLVVELTFLNGVGVAVGSTRFTTFCAIGSVVL